MLDIKKVKEEFIEERKKYNRNKNLFPGHKDYLDENPTLLTATYNNGESCIVVDMEALKTLPASTRNKIFKLINGGD